MEQYILQEHLGIVGSLATSKGEFRAQLECADQTPHIAIVHLAASFCQVSMCANKEKAKLSLGHTT